MEDSNLNGGQTIIHNARILYSEDFELIREYLKIKNGVIQDVGSVVMRDLQNAVDYYRVFED